MIDPSSLSASMIAALVVTKALESTGTKLSDSVWNLVGKLVAALKLNHPSTAAAIEKVSQSPRLSDQNPDVYGIEVLANQVEAAAQSDLEVRQALLQVVDEVQKQPGAVSNMSKLAEKIGTVIQGNSNTVNIEQNF